MDKHPKQRCLYIFTVELDEGQKTIVIGGPNADPVPTSFGARSHFPYI